MSDRQRHQRPRPIPAWLIATSITATAVFLAVLVVAIGLYLRPAQPVVQTDLAALLAEWQANPIAAQEKYQGKLLEVTGTVQRIDTNRAGQVVVMLAADAGQGTATVFLLDADVIGRMKAYPVGSKVTMRLVPDYEAQAAFRGRCERIVEK